MSVWALDYCHVYSASFASINLEFASLPVCFSSTLCLPSHFHSCHYIHFTFSFAWNRRSLLLQRLQDQHCSNVKQGSENILSPFLHVSFFAFNLSVFPRHRTLPLLSVSLATGSTLFSLPITVWLPESNLSTLHLQKLFSPAENAAHETPLHHVIHLNNICQVSSLIHRFSTTALSWLAVLGQACVCWPIRGEVTGAKTERGCITGQDEKTDAFIEH